MLVWYECDIVRCFHFLDVMSVILQKYLLSYYIHITKRSHVHHKYHKYRTDIIPHYSCITPYLNRFIARTTHISNMQHTDITIYHFIYQNHITSYGSHHRHIIYISHPYQIQSLWYHTLVRPHHAHYRHITAISPDITTDDTIPYHVNSTHITCIPHTYHATLLYHVISCHLTFNSSYHMHITHTTTISHGYHTNITSFPFHKTSHNITSSSRTSHAYHTPT